MNKMRKFSQQNKFNRLKRRIKRLDPIKYHPASYRDYFPCIENNLFIINNTVSNYKHKGSETYDSTFQYFVLSQGSDNFFTKTTIQSPSLINTYLISLFQGLSYIDIKSKSKKIGIYTDNSSIRSFLGGFADSDLINKLTYYYPIVNDILNLLKDKEVYLATSALVKGNMICENLTRDKEPLDWEPTIDIIKNKEKKETK